MTTTLRYDPETDPPELAVGQLGVTTSLLLERQMLDVLQQLLPESALAEGSPRLRAARRAQRIVHLCQELAVEIRAYERTAWWEEDAADEIDF